MASADENDTTIAAGIPGAIDPKKEYLVQLLKGVPFAGGTLRPGTAHRVSGEVLQQLAGGPHKDSIHGAKEA